MMACLWTAPAPRAQCEVATVYSAPDTRWNDMALYRAGSKLFIADEEARSIRVFDTATLASLGEIPLSVHVLTPPQDLEIHEESGQLFVVTDWGYATSASSLVVIDADTHQVLKVFNGLGNKLQLIVDESRDRLYLFDGRLYGGDQLTALDVNTHAVTGSLYVNGLFGSFHSFLQPSGGLNPVTGELLITNIHQEKFLVVNPASLTGTVVDAQYASGWWGIWNPLENKVYIDTYWGGITIHDLDTGTTVPAHCGDDGAHIYYNERTNRVYSSMEIARMAAILDGSTDACSELIIEGGLTWVSFTPSKHHVYWVGSYGCYVVDEDTLTTVGFLRMPGPTGGGTTGCQAIVDPDTEIVYIRSWRDMTTGEGSCVMAVDGRAPFITRQPEPRTVRWGESATLSVEADGVGALHYQWYRGRRGDTSQPVGDDAPALATPPLLAPDYFWVRIEDDLGRGDSREARVSIDTSPGKWVAQASATSQNLNAVCFVDPETGWAAGDWGTIRQTTDGGATWAAQTGHTTRELNSVCFSDASNGWIVGWWGDILHTTDGGDTWIPQASGTGKALFDVAFLDADNGWAVGATGTVLRTTDGGAHWQAAIQGIWDWLYTVSFANAGTGWLAGDDGVFFHTTDGGVSWTKRSAATIDTFLDSRFFESGTGWMVTDYGRIFRTTDGGASWGSQQVGSYAGALHGLEMIDGLTGWAVGDGGCIIKTVDGGENWSPVDSGTDKALRGIDFVSPTAGWAVGDDGTILKFQSEPNPADLNGDHAVDSQDLALLAALLAENLFPPAAGAGDVNGDGRPDVLDLLQLGRILQ